MSEIVQGAEAVRGLAGKTFGPSEWLTIDQDRIQRFADATGDHQWIHVDVERAKKELPGGKCIAHGYLTLSVLPIFYNELIDVRGAKQALNYGLDKLRFPSPVPSGSRLRASLNVLAVDEVSGGFQLKVAATIEVEGAPKPACVAEVLYRYYF